MEGQLLGSVLIADRVPSPGEQISTLCLCLPHVCTDALVSIPTSMLRWPVPFL